MGRMMCVIVDRVISAKFIRGMMRKFFFKLPDINEKCRKNVTSIPHYPFSSCRNDTGTIVAATREWVMRNTSHILSAFLIYIRQFEEELAHHSTNKFALITAANIAPLEES